MEDEEGEVEEVIPKVKKGDRYEMVHKENGQKHETKILSRARKSQYVYNRLRKLEYMMGILSLSVLKLDP